jgi:hypothetical protein
MSALVGAFAALAAALVSSANLRLSDPPLLANRKDGEAHLA